MLWANKKFIQSVTFTEDDADMALLEAIEKELSAAKYQTFSNLCKQALWQFLSVAESTSASENNPASNPLQQQLVQLQAQLGELEHTILTEEKNQFTRVEARLNRLAQQVAQVQANLDLQALQVGVSSSPPASAQPPQQQAIRPLEPSPAPQPPQKPATQPPQPQEKVAEAPADPLLKRIGSLIEDF
ncbi:MAG: hypothetical protein WBA77_14955 [Microcoleaceae cyanobacterium]